jgi:hypothetical protein
MVAMKSNKQKVSQAPYVGQSFIEPASDFAPSEASLEKKSRNDLQKIIKKTLEKEESPYEIASLVAVLSNGDAAALEKEIEEQGDALERRIWLARRLLKSVEGHLLKEPVCLATEAEAKAESDAFKRSVESWPYVGPGRKWVYPFKMLLRELEAAQGERKKGSTMLGSITTRTGLLAAIERNFKKAEAASIIEAECLTRRQFKTLMADPKRRGIKGVST